ncbi:MAG TPA: hypothetical protein P5121_39660, partial [Caldilineaceae bacterium]|nr:hypothetical protein [Caldilineaceae bacterium]
DATIRDAALVFSSHPLWVLGQSIRGYSCRFVSTGLQCNPGNSYTAPTVNDQLWKPGQLTTNGTYLFWVENFQNCSGSFCVDSPQGQLMKWKIRPRLFDSDPFVEPQPIAAQNTGGATFAIQGTQVGVANAFVYFNSSQGVTRIRSDALPAQAVIVPQQWEVTQAIQNFSNDVPLVANKPTYARVFATKVSGPRSNAVTAKLDAYGGAAQDQYVGTIYPVNGALNFPINVANTFAHANRDDGWLFQLPDHWTNAGKIKLQVTVNGNSNYQIATFGSKAPVCVVAIKVRTNGPTASDAGPNYAAAVGMVRRLYPASGVWTYHQDDDIAKLVLKWGGPFDLIPYPGYGPYSMPENQTRVFTSLVERDLFSDDPDACDDAGARTHYVGIISPETNTTNSSGGTGNGAGRLDYDQMWVKLPPQTIDPSNLTATRIATYAHELGHNYNREHVDCGSPNADEGLDNGYPYDKCMLDQRDQSAFTTYFGFDTWTQQPIAPNTAGDLMSYAQNLSPAKPRWISDYTWRALDGAISQSVVRNATSVHAAGAAAFAQAQTVVFVSGSYTATGGILDYAWGIPSSALSNKVQQKWQNAQALTTVEAAAANAATPNTTISLHLQLLAANGAVLDDSAVPELDAHGDVNTDERAFAFTFPVPVGQVAKVQLMSGELVLADLHPGPNAPVVTILQPAGNETIDQTMTLSWRATDADPDDRLLYTVQYSPDNGATWRALLTNLANPMNNETTTLDLSQLSGIPGSLPNGARIRVAASDGYNTTLATSAPFTVANRAPQPYILAPAPSQRYKAGEIVVVQGGADDAEEGGLSGAALTWTLDGAAVGSGTSATMEGLAPGQHTLLLTAKDSA